MKTKIIAYGLLLSLGLACSSKTKETEVETTTAIEKVVTLSPEQLKNVDLQTTKPESRTLSATLKVNGKIDVPPQNLVSISMQMGGYLKNTSLLPGMYVKKNSVIATMEDQQYIQLQQEYLSTLAKLNYAEKEYQRQKDLNQSQASSDKVFQMAEAEFKNLKITKSALAEKLRLIYINPNTLSENNISKSITIHSPIDGFVSKVNVNIGKYVSPTDVLFELINPTDIHLNLKVFEKDINKLFIGQRVYAYSNSNPDEKHEAEIILISQDISDNEHSAEVHCHFEQYDKKLLPGMYMNAEIELKNAAQLSIQKEAIVSFENKEYVFVKIGNSQYEMTEVVLGIAENGFTAITNAEVIKDKEIVIKGAYTLLMQLKNKEEE
ncbi:efflux RND transporter periplasmic adaptor subunit [Flavobacterium tegetincola]|uniref:efflux RND transporter periplasmic adaptor subunit n=1 Tax=Flavobacterium tegetincola TaxID=150172 RepID=UPI000419A83A|nr:efflux RND transporter periplasmic adaptor subunit [Flavobacterium tegetincola]